MTAANHLRTDCFPSSGTRKPWIGMVVLLLLGIVAPSSPLWAVPRGQGIGEADAPSLEEAGKAFEKALADQAKQQPLGVVAREYPDVDPRFRNPALGRGGRGIGGRGGMRGRGFGGSARINRGTVNVATLILQDEKDVPVRRAAIRLLGTVEGQCWPEAEAGLITALRTDRQEVIRIEAARALARGNCYSEPILAALRLAAGGGDADGNVAEASPHVRKAAKAALAVCLKKQQEKKRPPQDAPANAKPADSQGRSTRDKAPTPRSELEKALIARAQKNPGDLDRAQSQPGVVGAAARILLDEREAPMRRNAVTVLGTVDSRYWPEVEAALIAALRSDRNESVRLEAALALGKGNCCTEKTVAALRLAAVESTEDGNFAEPSERVHKAARVALKRCHKLLQEKRASKEPAKNPD